MQQYGFIAPEKGNIVEAITVEVIGGGRTWPTRNSISTSMPSRHSRSDMLIPTCRRYPLGTGL